MLVCNTTILVRSVPHICEVTTRLYPQELEAERSRVASLSAALASARAEKSAAEAELAFARDRLRQLAPGPHTPLQGSEGDARSTRGITFHSLLKHETLSIENCQA
jgi:hypothetical protein